MRNCYAFLLVGLLSLFFTTQASAGAADTTQSIPMIAQDSPFTIRMVVTPSDDSLNAVVGLSDLEVADIQDFVIAVRFNSDGTVTASNGSTFELGTPFNYQGGTSYLLQLNLDVNTATYSLKIFNPLDNSALTLAADYAFTSAPPALRYVSTKVFGDVPESDLQVSAIAVGVENVGGSTNNYYHATGVLDTVVSVQLTVTPSHEMLNAAIGMSERQVNSWNELSPIVRFNPNGTIDARDGGTYRADTTINYAKGITYYVTLDLNIPNETYDVFIYNGAGPAIQIANDYGFRRSADTLNFLIERIVTLNNESGFPGSFLAFDNVKIGAKIDDGAALSTATPVGILDKMVNVTFRATPSHNNMNAGIAFSETETSSWAQFSPILQFNTNGTLNVRNGGSYRPTGLTYKAGVTYQYRMAMDVANGTYSVWVDTSIYADPVMIAQDYNFRRAADTLAYFTTKVVYNPSEMGIPGSFVGVSDVVIDTVNVNLTPQDLLTVQQNIRTPLQQEAFTARFVVEPTHNKMNGAIGLSEGLVSQWGDFSTIVLFNPNGVVQVRNGNAYRADSLFTYKAGRKYMVQMDVNPPNQTYSVKIWDPTDGGEVQLATDYNFRTNNYDGDSLNYYVTRAVQDPKEQGIYQSELKILHFGIGNENAGGSTNNFIYDAGVLDGEVSVQMTVTPSSGNLNAAIGMSEGAVNGWGDLSPIVRFNPNGTVDARDGNTYRADTVFTYVKDQTYYITLDLNVPNETYDVIISTGAGAPIVIANDYGFRRSADTLNFLLERIVTLASENGILGSFLALDNIKIGTKIDDGAALSTVTDIGVNNGSLDITFKATPSNNNINAGIALSETLTSSWAQFSPIIQFNPNGTLNIRNGGSYRPTGVTYEAGEPLYFEVSFDIANGTYTVSVDKGIFDEPQVIAMDYNFRRAADTLRYFTTKVVYSPAEMGLPGSFVGVTDFTIVNSTNLAINAAPTINAIVDTTIRIDAGEQVLTFSGISDGGEGDQNIIITATIDNDSVITVPVITYTSPDSTGTITFSPIGLGTVSVRVTVKDNGGTANGGVDETSTLFVVTVDESVSTTEPFAGTYEIYPNPFSDHILLKNVKDVRSIEVISLTGQILQTLNNVADGDINLGLNHLESGAYLLKLRDRNNIITVSRIIKL